MKVKIPVGTDMTDVEHLTIGKEYKVGGTSEYGGEMRDDNGLSMYIYIPNSAHLKGQAWEIVE